MATLIDRRCDYLLLPRPWLEMNSALVWLSAAQNDALYVRGDAIVGGRAIRLPYWHKIVKTAKSDSK